MSSIVKGQDEMIKAGGRKSFAVLQKEIVVKTLEKSKRYLQISRRQFSGFRDFCSTFDVKDGVFHHRVVSGA